MDAAAAIEGHGGVATRAQLLAAGFTRRAIDGAVRRGRLVRARRGLLVAASAPPAVHRAAGIGGRVTCVTGLALAGVPLVARDSRVHAATSSARSYDCRDPDVRLHRSTSAVVAPVCVEEMLRHAATCLPDDELVVAIDGCLHRGLTSIAAVAGLAVRDRRRWERVLRQCDPRAESVPESLARLALTELAVPVWPQATIEGVGRVDFLVADRLVVEIDGRAYHEGAAAFVADRRRDRRLASRGFAVLRFAAAEVLRDRHRVARDVRRALAERTAGQSRVAS